MQRIEVGGIGIEYRWVGPPPGEMPTLVFLHEGLGCTEMWRDFPDRVAAATGCGALVYSRWGYGHSDPRPLPWPIDHMEQEGETGLPALLDALGVEDHILWGHSDGASIALVSAGHHADPRLKAIVSAAAHVFGGEEIGVRAIEAARQNFEKGGLRGGLSRYHSDPEGAFRGWADTWLHPEFRSWTIERYLAGISVPVLVAQGTRDEYGTMRQLESICSHLGDLARRVIIEEHGHQLHITARERMIEETVWFLARL